jgi:hypothetical protein
LSHFEIAETDITHELELVMDMVHLFEEDECVFDIHIEDLVDAFATSFDAEDLRFVSASLTELTRDVGIGEELEFDLFVTISITLGTAAFFAIEREVSCIETEIFCL